MKFTTSIIALFAIIGMSYGLECYNCLYYKGVSDPSFPASDSKCEKKPNKDSLHTCGNIKAATETPDISALGFKNLRNLTSKADVNPLAKWMCGKEAMENDGKKYVLRLCILAADNQDGVCSQISESVGGSTVTLNQCLCDTDKCNSAGVTQSSFIVASILTITALLFK